MHQIINAAYCIHYDDYDFLLDVVRSVREASTGVELAIYTDKPDFMAKQALQKARLARLHLRGKADIWSENGYGFAAEEPQEVIGKVFAVESIEPYDPRRLKRSLKGAGAELMKRDFPFGAEELARRLGVHAGADVRLAFTKIGNGFWAVRLK